MWLLRTDTAELKYFARNFDARARGGYAILSHTWKGAEQTFQEVRAIAEQCHRDGTNPRDFVHPKIRNCCIVAEEDAYRGVWIDSCCINKESSSELSEVINLMYQWYKESAGSEPRGARPSSSPSPPTWTPTVRPHPPSFLTAAPPPTSASFAGSLRD